ncbi:MAG: RNA polymerase sigma factor [Chloroflexota bacterium]|nr:MAG: hypothetical protein DLM70_16220 [Chloroflexota bacterium]
MRNRTSEEPAALPSDDLESALVDLMQEQQHALFNFALAITHDNDVADDCCQHAFVRAYEQLKRGKAVNKAWLYTVTRNAAIDALRRRRHERPSMLLDNEAEKPGADTSSIRAALDQLAPGDREVLYLFVVDRFPAKDIAGMLGVRPEAVYMRISRARERLRKLYGDKR